MDRHKHMVNAVLASLARAKAGLIDATSLSRKDWLTCLEANVRAMVNGTPASDRFVALTTGGHFVPEDAPDAAVFYTRMEFIAAVSAALEVHEVQDGSAVSL